MSNHRLDKYVNKIGKKYPNCWKNIEEFRKYRGKNIPNWPSWCYAPIASGLAIVSDNNKVFSLIDAISIPALAAWRKTKSIYIYIYMRIIYLQHYIVVYMMKNQVEKN